MGKWILRNRDWKLALISFVLLPLVAVLTVVFRRISRQTYRISRTRLTDINTFLSENISGMRIIQIFGRQERKFEEFNDKNYRLYRAFFREMLVFAVFRPLIYILSIISLMIVLGVGSRDVLGETITIGTLYIFSQYIKSFFEPIQELAEQFSTLQSSIASAEKIFTIMDEETLVKEDENPVVLSRIKGRCTKGKSENRARTRSCWLKMVFTKSCMSCRSIMRYRPDRREFVC